MATANPFKTVTPEDWMKRTNVGAFAVRSGALKDVDRFYITAYGENENFGIPSQRTLQELMRHLTRYLQEHKASTNWTGPDKKDLNRNKASGGLMKQLYDFVVESIGPQKTVPVNDTRHTRAGVVYLLGNIQPSMNLWSVASSAVAVGTTGGAPHWNSLTMGKLTVDDPAGKLKAGLGAITQYKQEKNTVADPRSFWEKISDAIRGLADSIEKYFKFRTESFYTNIGKVIRLATDFVVKMLTKAAPIVGAALDVGQGFIKVCMAASSYMDARRERTKFLFVPGHPALLAQAIEDQMKSDIRSAALQICKGVLSAALGAFTAVLGPVILEAFTAVIGFIGRYYEIQRIEAFCIKARLELNVLRLRQYNFSNAAANTGSYGMLDDAEEFSEFYQKGVDASVAIPILTLNSGICGDLMQMIQMYEPDNKEIHPDTFKVAASYFQRLKLAGSKHLQNSGIQYNSPTPYVRRLVNHAVYGHQGTQTRTEKVLSVAAA